MKYKIGNKYDAGFRVFETPAHRVKRKGPDALQEKLDGVEELLK